MPPRRRQQQTPPSQEQAVEYIAAALLIGGGAQAMSTTLSPLVGVPAPDLLTVLLIAQSRPIPLAGSPVVSSATATHEYRNLEATYRAHYVYAASTRLRGLRGEARELALQREQTYFNQHMAASRNRHTSAVAVDQARARFGDELGWYAKMDSRTSAECREANGKNFSATRVPAIGYPGAVHPFCRCKPGRKHATSQTVYSIRPAKHQAA